MARRARRRRLSRPQEQGRKRTKLLYGGIAGSVVAGIVALLAFTVIRSSSGGDFVFSMYQGEEVIGASQMNFADLFPAEKPVVLNFWAGLCPPCRAEMPGFQAVYDQNKDDYIMLGIDIGPFMGLGSNQDASNLLQELNIT